METELLKFIKVWVIVIISICFCYTIKNIIPKGTKRLLLVLPVVCLFLYLPVNLTSPHLGGITAFFIAWLANFKLLLFAFGRGPLSSDPSISLPLFIAVSCLPIKIQHHRSPPKPHTDGHNNENPPPNSHQNGQTKQYKFTNKLWLSETEVVSKTMNPQFKLQPKSNSPKKQNKFIKSKEGPLNYAIKILILVILVRVYDYIHFIHPNILLILYSFHIYFLLEIILAIGAALAETFLGLELEPQFNEPYLATSLQNFWGRRWNLMVSSILRPTIYEPALAAGTHILGRKWAPLPAVFATFVVSALMHELMFFYLGRKGPSRKPSWEVTWFFLLHGTCVTLEIALKNALKGKLQVPRVISWVLTVGFVMVTGFWLFFPKFIQCEIDMRAFEEYAALRAWMTDVGQWVARVFD